MKRASSYVGAVVAALLLLSHITPAQQAQPGPARGRGPGGGPPPGPDDTMGFVSLFDGVSLNGWDGDPMFWRVENGVIVAESTPKSRLRQHVSHLARRNAQELRTESRRALCRILGQQRHSGEEPPPHRANGSIRRSTAAMGDRWLSGRHGAGRRHGH